MAVVQTQLLRRARGAVAVVFFVNGAVFAAWAARVPAIRTQLDLSDGQLGIALLGLGCGALLGLPVAGLLVARWGTVAIIRAGLLAYCAALAAVPFTGGLAGLGAALAALGWGNSLLDVAMNAHGVLVERGYGRQILAGFHAWFSFGGLAGAVAGVAAAAAGITAGAHLVTAAVVLVAVGLAATGFLLPAAGESATSTREGLARPNGGLALLGALAACCLLCEGVANDWSAVYVRSSTGASPGVAAAAFAGFSLTMAVGRLSADRVATRVGRVRFLTGAGLLAGAGFSLGLALPIPAAAVAGFALLGVGLAGIVPTLFSAAAQDRHPPGPAISTVSTLGYLGFLAGPPLIGSLAQATSLRAALLVPVVLLMIAVPAGATILGRHRHGHADPA